MKIPEFTAQDSLYRTSNHYRSLGQRGEPRRTVIIPQRGGPGFEGLANCLSDCADEHPNWTSSRCAASCRDPIGIPGSGSEQKRDLASILICEAGYHLCDSVGFKAFRPDLWFSCLFGGICSCEELRDACMSG
jgi:hypothetical protein